VTDSSLELRKCKTCGNEKPLVDNFRLFTNSHGTYWTGDCHQCLYKKKKAWNIARPKDIAAIVNAKDNARRRNLRKTNVAEIRAKDAAYRKANPEKFKIHTAAYLIRNRERLARLREENREQINAKTAARARIRYRRDPKKACLKIKLRNGRKRATQAEPITPKHIIDLFKKQRGSCAICKTKLKAGYHIDHIMPLAKGGAHVLQNLQLTCPFCNLQKNNQDPLTYMQRRGFLL